MDAELEATLTADLAEIARLAKLVEEFVVAQGLPHDLSYKMNLALDELLTNTISYGFTDGGEHNIAVRLSFLDGELTGEIRDDGKEFNPLERPEPDTTLSVEDRPIGGLGILFVKKFMDEVAYRRENGQNVITVKKRNRDKDGDS